MGDLLRLLALDGPVAGAGVLVALAWLIVRLESTRSENAAAHAAIATNIDGVKAQMSRDITPARPRVERLDSEEVRPAPLAKLGEDPTVASTHRDRRAAPVVAPADLEILEQGHVVYVSQDQNAFFHAAEAAGILQE